MIVFDGRKLAQRLEEKLIREKSLQGKSLLILQSDVGKGESRYVQLKREMGEKLGVRVQVELCGDSAVLMRKLIDLRSQFDGVMVQLPIVECTKKETEEILREIPFEKDVDGLNPEGAKFCPAVGLAVCKVLDEIKRILGELPAEGVIVGAKGVSGGGIMRCLEKEGFNFKGLDKGDSLSELKNYGLIISATGVKGLIKGNLLKEGVIAIDIGYPRGDFDFGSLISKANLLTPVPGGVGPVTIVCLFENLSQV